MVRSRDKTEEGAADVARCQMFKSDQKISPNTIATKNSQPTTTNYSGCRSQSMDFRGLIQSHCAVVS